MLLLHGHTRRKTVREPGFEEAEHGLVSIFEMTN
jgi:hypothetical protein